MSKILKKIGPDSDYTPEQKEFTFTMCSSYTIKCTGLKSAQFAKFWQLCIYPRNHYSRQNLFTSFKKVVPKGDHLCPRFLGPAQVEYFPGGVLEGLCPGHVEMAGHPAWVALALLLHERHRQADDKSSRSRVGVRNAKRAACSAPWGRKERSASQTQHQGLLCCLSAEELLRVIMTWSDLPWPCVCVSLQGHTHSCYFLLRPPSAITEPASIRPTSPLICCMLGNKMTLCQQAIRTTINRLLGFEHMDFVLTVRAV